MKCEDMSDFEINCQVAKANNWTSKSFVHEIHSGKWNPCQNPADAWPVITGNNISIVATDSEWIALPDNAVIDGITGDATSMIYVGDECIIGKNPLRAAMIVFLKMQEKAQ